VSWKLLGFDVGPDLRPPIFLAALNEAGVKAEEPVYAGDQYSCDVVGACVSA